jgi:hypothetical protein
MNTMNKKSIPNKLAKYFLRVFLCGSLTLILSFYYNLKLYLMELDHKKIKSKGKKKKLEDEFFLKKKNKNKLKEDASLYI